MKQGIGEAMSVDRLAAIARNLYADGPWLMRNMSRYRLFICPFERLVPLVPTGSSVLDVGCGSGLFVALLAGVLQELEATGFDTSGPAIDAANRMAERARAVGLSARLRFIRQDVATPWPAGRYDVVSLIDVLHHVDVPRQKAVFCKAAEALEPGGILLYKDMADRPAFHALMNRVHDLVLARQWIHYVPVQAVDGWATELGLEQIRAESQSRYWYRHDVRAYRKT